VDVFSRTFLPAATEAGIPVPTVSRHLPVFRRCVDPDDAAVVVSRCVRPGRVLQGDFLVLLTYRRLVVTRETLVVRQLRLHLNTDLRHLHNVTWNADPGRTAVELAATAVDGVRERFWMRVADEDQMWHLDALLQHVFRAPAPAAAIHAERRAGAAADTARVRFTPAPAR
jgi:hypothetical protein